MCKVQNCISIIEYAQDIVNNIFKQLIMIHEYTLKKEMFFNIS